MILNSTNSDYVKSRNSKNFFSIPLPRVLSIKKKGMLNFQKRNNSVLGNKKIELTLNYFKLTDDEVGMVFFSPRNRPIIENQVPSRFACGF